ncbi:MAG: cardiolipin synthase [Burkholderiales bacterium]
MRLQVLLLALAHVAVFVAVTLRVLARRNPPGVSMAWILLVLLVPVGGLVLYVMIGERRLGRRWIQRAEAERAAIARRFERLAADAVLDPADTGPVGEPVARLAQSLGAIPVMRGHHVELLADGDLILRTLIDDVDACREHCSLEFYIWHEGGLVDDLVAALIRAAKRGVRVTALMDGLGSRPFVERGRAIASMRSAGIEVVVVLPVSALRMAVARADLRNHRKIAVFDDRIAWTGSFNLADPRHFKRDAGVGQWVDAMVRIQGPSSLVLGALSNAMAVLQAGPRLRDERAAERGAVAGPVALQAYPSGPGFAFQHVESVILTAIYAARRELILTTPYFAPGESVVTALRSAARRGVDVVLVLPWQCDSRTVQWASASYFDELLSAGVKIERFHGGLLHTKSMVIDRELSVFGTVNFDLRSFHLNFELSMLIYDRSFAESLLALQRRYLEDCEPLQLDAWRARPFWRRMVENAAQLASPVL